MTAAAAPSTLRDAVNAYLAEAAKVEQGGGPSGIERQHRHGRLTARERIDLLLRLAAKVPVILVSAAGIVILLVVALTNGLLQDLR